MLQKRNRLFPLVPYKSKIHLRTIQKTNYARWQVEEPKTSYIAKPSKRNNFILKFQILNKFLSPKPTIRKLKHKKKHLKTKQLLHETFSPVKNLHATKAIKISVLCCLSVEKFNILIECMLHWHILSYSQNIWAAGFRPLIKQMNFHQSWLYVDMVSIIVSWHTRYKLVKAQST